MKRVHLSSPLADSVSPASLPHAGFSEEGVSLDRDAEITRLGKLSPLDYEQERSSAAKRLGIRVTALDRFVKNASAKERAGGGNDPFTIVEPWASPVELSALLDEICFLTRRFVICDDVTLRAVALWTAFTWLIDWAQVAPLLVITAPEKRCGKSRLLSLLKRLTYRPLIAANISTAAIYRVIEGWAPTLLIDEADTFLGGSEELRGILNSGHTRDSAKVIRLDGDSHEPRAFSTWGAKAIAGIGRHAETIMDRAIVVVLSRKRAGEVVEKLNHADPADFDRLTRMLARFAEDAGEIIKERRPIPPKGLHDRAQDNWEPLLAIADYAGGHWPETARATALQLSGSPHEALSLSAQLLRDIRDIFEERGCDRITTADLLAALNADEEGPWATHCKGRPLTPRSLAKLLREYGIGSQNIWVESHSSPKGYKRDQFKDAFMRYLPEKPAQGGTGKPAQGPQLLRVPFDYPVPPPFPPAPPPPAPRPPTIFASAPPKVADIKAP